MTQSLQGPHANVLDRSQTTLVGVLLQTKEWVSTNLCYLKISKYKHLKIKFKPKSGVELIVYLRAFW